VAADYAKHYGTDYHYTTVHAYKLSEIFLTIMLFTILLHEVGEVFQGVNVRHVFKYLVKGRLFEILAAHIEDDNWNYFDLLSTLSTVAWFLLRLCDEIVIARIIISVAAIPSALVLLRYFFLFKPLGELVIMIYSMLQKLAAFIIVYLLSIAGFGVAFYGLYHGSDLFSDGNTTFLGLFSFTLGNFDFSSSGFETTSFAVNTLGTYLAVIFLIFTSLVLLNLLIAEMTNSHGEISAKTFHEWSYQCSKTIASAQLRRESNVLCMLPAPLNLITTAIGPLHYFILDSYPAGAKRRFSLVGTFSSWLMCLCCYPFRMICYLSYSWANIKEHFDYADIWKNIALLPLNILIIIMKTLLVDILFIYSVYYPKQSNESKENSSKQQRTVKRTPIESMKNFLFDYVDEEYVLMYAEHPARLFTETNPNLNVEEVPEKQTEVNSGQTTTRGLEVKNPIYGGVDSDDEDEDEDNTTEHKKSFNNNDVSIILGSLRPIVTDDIQRDIKEIKDIVSAANYLVNYQIEMKKFMDDNKKVEGKVINEIETLVTNKVKVFEETVTTNVKALEEKIDKLAKLIEGGSSKRN
jgi:hypothetical protein